MLAGIIGQQHTGWQAAAVVAGRQAGRQAEQQHLGTGDLMAAWLHIRLADWLAGAAALSCISHPSASCLPSPLPCLQRCRVHSTLFMPLYASPRRDACLGVFEVVLTEPDVNFAGMVAWIK